MTSEQTIQPSTPWVELRRVSGLSQREVERRLGWKTGHLSWIERGIRPSPEQDQQLRRFYAELLAEGGL